MNAMFGGIDTKLNQVPSRLCTDDAVVSDCSLSIYDEQDFIVINGLPVAAFFFFLFSSCSCFICLVRSLSIDLRGQLWTLSSGSRLGVSCDMRLLREGKQNRVFGRRR